MDFDELEINELQDSERDDLKKVPEHPALGTEFEPGGGSTSGDGVGWP